MKRLFMTAGGTFLLLFIGLIQVYAGESSDSGAMTQAPPTFPGILEKEALYAGNPLATYVAMCDREDEYLHSQIFANIYPEIRCNFEEFLGDYDAGLRAMDLPALKREYAATEVAFPSGYQPQPFLKVLEHQAKNTQLVIWGEEHHLPQTRSVYEAMLRLLWSLGYRYLAAETFEESVMTGQKSYPDYHSGYYVRDPVFASAFRVATDLGYKLIAYETKEQGEPDDISFRDRTQAENIYNRIFKTDPRAKVLVIAGRGHISEITDQTGWTPMASVLKRMTQIDPFTIYSPTMTERLRPENEHPWYRHATETGAVGEPVIFVDKDSDNLLGTESFDAYVFFPRVKVIDGRPDWMISVLNRVPVSVTEMRPKDSSILLAQAFRLGEPPLAIPVDQMIIDVSTESVKLMLPSGDYWIRIIDRSSNELARDTVSVP